MKQNLTGIEFLLQFCYNFAGPIKKYELQGVQNQKLMAAI